MYYENFLFLMAVANCPEQDEMAVAKGDVDLRIKTEMANKVAADHFDPKNRGYVDRKRRNDAKNKGRERSKRSHWDHNMYESGRYHSDSRSAKERRYEASFHDLMKDGSVDLDFNEAIGLLDNNNNAFCESICSKKIVIFDEAGYLAEPIGSKKVIIFDEVGYII